MITRKELRSKTAEHLNSISADELFERFDVTRVGKIDGLDVIGVPVWSAYRPLAKTVSVVAGKSFTDELARAGAIAEAIEYRVFENPPGDDRCGVIHLLSGTGTRIHSDSIWMEHSISSNMFRSSSNGNAVGANLEDALLQGILEVVERDAITLRTHDWNVSGVMPPKVGMENLPESSLELIHKCEAADLRVLLFHCTMDIKLPVYWAVLCDPFGGLATFGGWGCDLLHEDALNRAILEAIQSRAVMISGVRDDVQRRNFAQLQSIDPRQMIADYEAAPALHLLPDRGGKLPVDAILAEVIDRLGTWARNLYYRAVDLGDVVAAKSIIIGL